MMKNMLETVEDGKHGDIREVFLHVHTVNEKAQAFYEGFGFARAGELKGYYTGVEPPNAFLYRRAVNGASLDDLSAPTGTESAGAGATSASSTA